MNDQKKTYRKENKVLGKGELGDVYLGTIVETNEKIALKEIPNNLDKDAEKSLSNEVSISSQLDNTNIVRMLEIVEINNKKYLAYELCNGGDLRRYMRYFKKFDEELIQIITIHMINGLRELHRNRVIHHDIKPENILIKLFPGEDLTPGLEKEIEEIKEITHMNHINQNQNNNNMNFNNNNYTNNNNMNNNNFMNNNNINNMNNNNYINNNNINNMNNAYIYNNNININYLNNNNMNINNINNNNQDNNITTNNNNDNNTPNGESVEEKERILKILKEAQFKLSDFGLSKLKNDVVERNLCGSPLYMSPELFRPETSINSIENYQVDIWALGVLIFEMFFGRRPFEAFSIDELSKMYKKGEYYLNLEENESISKELLSFINMCLQEDPKIRANVEMLDNSDFVNEEIDHLKKSQLNKEELMKELGSSCKIDSKNNIVLDIRTIYFKDEK